MSAVTPNKSSFVGINYTFGATDSIVNYITPYYSGPIEN